VRWVVSVPLFLTRSRVRGTLISVIDDECFRVDATPGAEQESLAV
jgi:hypothetical protein